MVGDKVIGRNEQDIQSSKKTMLVGVTGAVGSGKTTLVKYLVDEISERGYVVHVVEETVSDAINSFAKKMRHKGYRVDRPIETLSKARECEDIALLEFLIIDKMLRRIMDALYNIGRYTDYTQPDIVITDRTHYDWLYFFVRFVLNRDFTKDVMNIVSKSLHVYSMFPRYDLLVVCDFRDIPNEILQSDFLSKVRIITDTEYQERKLQHEFINALVMNSGVKYIYAKGDLKTRVKYASQTIIEMYDRLIKSV